MEKVLLYSFKADWIKVTIEAFFDEQTTSSSTGTTLAKE